jgi:hypothetical protein
VAKSSRAAAPGPRRFDLKADARGAAWDLLLYVPVVVALALIGVRLWFGGDRGFSYGLTFLASLFFFIGGNRILKTRLIWLPTAPQAIEFGEEGVCIALRGGRRIELVKEARIYTDVAGRSFGVSGMERGGRRLQYVFHRGQFADQADYDAVQEALRKLQPRK